MGRLCDVEEVLRVSAPELVLFAVVVDSLATSSRLRPLVQEALLDGLRKLDEVDWVGGEESQEERSLFFLFVVIKFGVGHYNVVHVLLLVSWAQPHRASDFSLGESLTSFSSFEDNVVPVDLPKSVTLGLDANDQEIDRNVITL